MTNETNCAWCGEPFKPTEYTPGYATLTTTNERICFDCCGKNDAKILRETGKLTGYLSMLNDSEIRRLDRARYATWTGRYGKFTNWPGTFEIPVYGIKYSRNNFGADRYDFWFTWEGHQYWGVNIGDSQIARVKRLKGKAK